MKLGENRGCSCGCVCGGDGARVLGSLATSPTFLGDRNQPLYLLVGVGLLVKMTATAPDAERLFRFKYRHEGRGFSLAGPVCHRHHHGHLCLVHGLCVAHLGMESCPRRWLCPRSEARWIRLG